MAPLALEDTVPVGLRLTQAEEVEQGELERERPPLTVVHTVALGVEDPLTEVLREAVGVLLPPVFDSVPHAEELREREGEGEVVVV